MDRAKLRFALSTNQAASLSSSTRLMNRRWPFLGMAYFPFNLYVLLHPILHNLFSRSVLQDLLMHFKNFDICQMTSNKRKTFPQYVLERWYFSVNGNLLKIVVMRLTTVNNRSLTAYKNNTPTSTHPPTQMNKYKNRVTSHPKIIASVVNTFHLVALHGV